jgi:hypothetical protein
MAVAETRKHPPMPDALVRDPGADYPAPATAPTAAGVAEFDIGTDTIR